MEEINKDSDISSVLISGGEEEKDSIGGTKLRLASEGRPRDAKEAKGDADAIQDKNKNVLALFGIEREMTRRTIPSNVLTNGKKKFVARRKTTCCFKFFRWVESNMSVYCGKW